MNELATVEYRMAAMTGLIHVDCQPWHPDDYILQKAKEKLIDTIGPLPHRVRQFEILSREQI